jgi:hypothetical protein
MAIPVKHTIRLEKRETFGDPLRAGFGVKCSCQWEGMAHTRVTADAWVNRHAFAQTMRGNEVIIEIDPALDPPKVEEDAQV